MKGHEARMPLGAHLRELRLRAMVALGALAIATAAAMLFSKDILAWLMSPARAALPPGAKFVALGPLEGWLVLFKVSLACGAFAASPVVFHQSWSFAAPAFGRAGRRRLALAACSSAALFAAGGAFCYYLVLPQAFAYFAGLMEGTGVAMTPQIGLFAGFVLKAVVAFGLVFDVPLCVVLLARWGVVSVGAMSAARKYVIVAAFVAAAIITPPDVLTQVALALPLIALYEAALLAARIMKCGQRT